MTDSTDEDENSSDTTAKPDVDSRVPSDTDWDLDTQIPFDEGETHDLTSAIIVGVARAEGVSPMEIKGPPLYEVLDVAALEDAFFGSSIVGQRSSDLRSVEFMYRGHRIVVRSDAWVQVYRPDEE